MNNQMDVISTDRTPVVMFSELDASVNFVLQSDVGFLESRYVRRTDDYFITYLSSQTGCNQGCRMCHLTATNQRKFVNATHDDFLLQALPVLEHYKTKVPAKLMHYNYMARGEPLDNPGILYSNSSLFPALSDLAAKFGDFRVKHIISTIMPHSVFDKKLEEVFDGPIFPELYYSLYSLNAEFRKKWLPKAIDPQIALDKLTGWQQATGKRFKIHYAFIANENDAAQDVDSICDALISRNLEVDINVVRYNPYSSRYGEESPVDIIERNMDIFKQRLPGSKIQLVTKVGADVKASCGMFVGDTRRGTR